MGLDVSIVPTVVPRRLSAAWHHDGMRVWGRRSVSAGGDIGVAVTGDHNQILVAPPTRSAYEEQVRRIAPPELSGRERELAELATFCTDGSGPAYLWWRAGAWAGKTALMSWFALHPPRGVRVVSFLVTARLGAQNDTVAYTDVVLEQLAEVVGEPLPVCRTEATREAHLMRLYREAAQVCASRGERLLLLVDGLDEDRGVTTSSDAHSIAGLLPGCPEHGMRVLVSGRLNPPLPDDVPDGHPLRDTAVVRVLAPSPRAKAVRVEAERELKRLLEAGGLEHDLLALVAAAGGGLTADDLAELTGAVSFRVRDVLRTRAGRTFEARGGLYLLAHEELRVGAEEMLGARELDRGREQLHVWADGYSGRDWPADTPEYLLRGYFAMLRARQDTIRMTALALDRARQGRLRELTGGDAAALAEIRSAQESLLDRDAESALEAMMRLAVRRDELHRHNAGLSSDLPVAWAGIGRYDRAEALAHSLPDRGSRAAALADIACELEDAGRREESLRVLSDAEHLGRRDGDGRFRNPAALRSIRYFWTALGDVERARTVIRDEAMPWLRSDELLALVRQLVQRDEIDAAESMLPDIEQEEARARAVAEITSALAEEGDFARAEALARRFPPAGRALAEVAYAAGEAGDGPLCRRLFDDAVDAAESSDDLGHVIEGLAWAGMFDRVESLVSGAPPGRTPSQAWSVIAQALVEAGQRERAEELAATRSDPQERDWMTQGTVRALAWSGEHGNAIRLLGTIGTVAVGRAALHGVVAALVDAGAHEQAARIAMDTAVGSEWVVEALLGEGNVGRATEVAESAADRHVRVPLLIRVAVWLARDGKQEEAECLLHELTADRSDSESLRARRTMICRTVTALADDGHTDQARALLSGLPPRPAEPEPLGEGDEAEALAVLGEYEEAEALARQPQHSFFRSLILARIARRMVTAGDVDRLADLMDASDEEERQYVWPAVAEEATERGDVDLAIDGLTKMASVDRRCEAAGRIVRWTVARGDDGDREWAGHLLERMAVDAEAAAADAARMTEAHLAGTADADTASGWRAAARKAQAAVARARVALGDRETAARWLAGAEAAVAADPVAAESSWWFADLAPVQLGLGRFDQVERTVAGMSRHEEDWARSVLVRIFLAEGETERAGAQARRIDPGSDRAVEAYIDLAEHTGRDEARRWLMLALHHGEWTQALPTLLWAEPTAPEQAAAACTDELPADSPTADELPADSPTAARTSAQCEN